MNSKYSKILTIVSLIIAVIAAFFYIRILSAGDEAFTEGADALDLQNSVISPFVWITMIVLGATIFFALLSSILNMMKKPEALKKTLLSIAILGVILVVSYLLNDSAEVLDAQGKVLKGGAAGETSNVWSSAGIWFSQILLGVSSALFLLEIGKGLVKS